MTEEMHTRAGRCSSAMLGHQCSILTVGHAPPHMAMTATGPMFWGSDPANRLTAEGVADLLDVSRSTISSYAARGQMPAPTECPCCGYGPTWDRVEIEAWQATRPGRTGRPPKEKR